jgi:hypothetical protein
LHVIEGGDHSFKVPKSVGKTQEVVWGEIQTAIVFWLMNGTN